MSRPVGIAGSYQASGMTTSEFHKQPDSPDGAFRPPHELADSSYVGDHSLAGHSLAGRSTRHKSIADRLKSLVFEQTGHVPISTASGFLA